MKLIQRLRFPRLMEKRDFPFSAEERFELKIATPYGSPALGRSWILMHPEGFKTAYAARVVNNLYLDTIDLRSFNDNLSGVSERLKLRLRWYGQIDRTLIRQPVLELKIKQNLLGDKRKAELDLALDLKRPYHELLKEIRSSAGEEWHALLLNAVQPTIINRYMREYYISPDGAVRVTLDYAQKTFNQRHGSRPNLNRPLPTNDTFIIEIKALPQFWERVERVMGFFPIQRSRNSKYVNGMSGGPL